MNRSQAEKLAEKLIATWPEGPRRYVWIEQLWSLDYEHAHAAILSMTKTERRMTVALMLDTYEAQRTAARRRAEAQQQLDLTTTRECACTPESGHMCEHEVARGLAGVAHVRSLLGRARP